MPIYANSTLKSQNRHWHKLGRIGLTTPLFSTSGGMGKEADRLLRRMAERMSIKRGENYSSVVSFLRRRFRFDLLKTCVIAMRGYKKPATTAAKIDTLDLDLRTTASSC